jgi:hypothetical protein
MLRARNVKGLGIIHQSVCGGVKSMNQIEEGIKRLLGPLIA